MSPNTVVAPTHADFFLVLRFVFRDTCYNLIKENWLKVYSYALVHGGTNSKDVQQIIATTTNANGYNDNSITTADDEVEGQIQSQLVIEDAVDQLETSNSSSSDTSGGEVECECECITRFHKIMSPVIDETFDVSLERFWDILYGSKKGECMPRGFEDMYTDLPAGFMHWFLKLKRKSRNLQISPWVDVSDSSFSVARLPYSKVKNGMSRSLSYDINLGVCIPTSYVEESIIQFIPGKSLCIGSITKTPSAPFGDQFATNMRYCILRTDDNRCRFVVSYGFEFTPTASWMAKSTKKRKREDIKRLIWVY